MPPVGAPGVVSVGAGQEEEEEEEAGADREPDEFLQDSLRTPIRSNGPPDEDLEWLTELLKTPPPKQARPASPPSSSDDLTSEEQLQMLFNDSVAECKGLPVTHWNFDENKVHRALHDLVDDAAFYIGATVNPRRRYLGGESRGGSMPGHCQRWERLTVVHLANGIGARRVETNLIMHAMDKYGERLCTNTAMDSRGVSPDWPAFVYVCTGRRQTPGPPGLKREPATP